MNSDLQTLLTELDNSTCAIREYSIHSKLIEVAKGDESKEAKSEIIAFAFCEDYTDKSTSWGTYFGPMTVWTNDNGDTYESPSIGLIDKEMIDYWGSRVEQTNNPVMKARYSGIIWDLTEKAIGEKPNFKYVLECITSLLYIVNNDLCVHPTETINKAKRAYNLSKSINNTDLITRTIEAAIKLEDRISEGDNAGTWGFCFDWFVLEKSKLLTQEQEDKLLSDLESHLDESMSENSPWLCESAGLPLAKYYRSKKLKQEVDRVIEIVGGCFENACDNINPFQASGWLKHAHDLYTSFNLNEKAENVSRKISEIGPDVVRDMKTISHSTKIPTDELEEFLDRLTSGGITETLNNIAIHYIPKKGDVEKQVLEQAKSSPISYLFSKVIQDHKGRPVATIGSIDSDLEGNIIHQLSQNLGISSFFLSRTFLKAREKYDITAEQITDHILQSSIFEKTRKDIIYTGINAYLNEDFITTIHVLVPQAESAIRNLVEYSGGAILKPNRNNGLQLRTFDDLLRDEHVENCFGTDISFYFRILLTEQRGWNIRNDVCHGIVPSDTFNYSVADRVIHVLLCLALAKEND